MADSSITKKARATALQDLIEEQPFQKISVGDICERCQMNRKSFYYHFRDKYDLVNWIFDTEFIEAVKNSGAESTTDAFQVLCDYFYENRSFYRRALKIEGQNSFTDHFRQLCQPVIARQLEELAGDEAVTSFYVNFFADAILCAIERWLLEKNCVSSEQFKKQLAVCTRLIVDSARLSLEQERK
ncbi:MAG: dihydroxyacetone kinase transcriptional activator DhaS [Oscillospiraceae bacterium]|nr:dihydroxyacetone kinase transcriptional activator DhaS [Oscillospiraceae bacterium]